MTWVLFNRNERGRPHILKTYATRKGALIGMRASNRNAGWRRVSLCYGGICQIEWCSTWSNGLPLYDYAPYVIANQYLYDQKYPRQGVAHELES